MREYIFVLLLLSVGPASLEEWSISKFFENQTQQMKAFFQEQKNKVESIVTTSFDQAVEMHDSVNNYMEQKQKVIADEVNSYVNAVERSGRKMADTWSYTPYESAEDRLENPDVVLPVPAIIANNGYLCETHTVISKGYILNIHRIPHGKNGKTRSKKTVFLQHGLFASSADWIMNGPQKALAYVLADAGYDVWMSNIRGNRYSRDHAWLKTDSKTYWNFSWHDVAEHDVPEIIDYILNLKGSGTKISYIGHSMGTTILFAMLTLRPEYNTILSGGIALAPVVFLSDLKSPIKSLAPIASNVAYMEMMYGSHEFVPKDSSLGRISSSCHTDHIDTMVCKNIVFYICGFNEEQFNKTLLPVFLAHLGTGTAWKTAVHFAQEIVSGGKFQKFDYGEYYNNKIYGAPQPPEYDLGKVTLPISLFWAENDLLSSETDVMKLYRQLPATTELYKIPDPKFNHVDYLWAIDAPLLLNNKLLQSLENKFNSHRQRFLFSLRL